MQFFSSLLCLLLLASATIGQTNFTISGMVSDQQSGEALPGANIFHKASAKGTSTDLEGRYRLVLPANNKADSVLIEFSFAGYVSAVKKVKANTDQLVNISLRPDTRILNEIEVRADSYNEQLRNTQMSVAKITADEVKLIPVLFGEADIIKALQLKPGVQSGGEGTTGLYVRGGGPDQNLVLMDGAQVYNPSHLFGFFSVFNTDAVRSAELYKGDFPARYGGRLSSVLDISMKEGNKKNISGEGGLGLIASRLTLSGPLQKDKSSFMIAGRRTYFDVFTRAINQLNEGKPNTNPIPDYYFTDFNARLDFDLGPKDKLMLSGYLGRDVFGFRNRDTRLDFSWGNTVSTLRWTRQANTRLAMRTALSFSDYKYTIANRFDVFGFQLQSKITDFQASLDADYRLNKRHQLSAGGTLIRHGFVIGRFEAGSDDGSFSVGAGNQYQALETGLYAGDEITLNDAVKLQAGLRWSGFLNEGKFFNGLEPRLSSSVKVNSTTSLKASYAGMYQYVHLVSNSGASLPTDIWYPSNEKVRPQQSQQIAAGFSKTFGNGRFLLSNEYYYKWMGNQTDFRDGAQLIVNPNLEDEFVFGRGWAYGTEVYIEKKQGSTTGWLGYTLSWAWRSFPDIMDGRRFHPRYDRRHDVTAVVIHRFNERLSVTGSWVYGTGNAISLPIGRFLVQGAPNTSPFVVPIFTERNSFRTAAYHRLDFGLVWRFSPRWGESDLTFSVYNMYNRRNPFFIYFEELRDTELNVTTGFRARQVSLFPVIPAVTYNFKF